MKKVSDLSEEGKENLLDQLCNIFEDIGVGLDKGDSFMQNALVHLSNRFEISETGLYDFYLKSLKG